jgi:hypothetical protein
VLVVDLLFEPREHSLRPFCGVFAESRAAEVNPLAVAVAEGAFEGVAIGAL